MNRTNLLRRGVKHSNAKPHEHMPANKHSPEANLHAGGRDDRADKHDRCAAQRDQVGPPPVQQEAADDGEDGVDEGVGAADDPELRVVDAQLIAQRVFERAQRRACPGVPDW